MEDKKNNRQNNPKELAEAYYQLSQTYTHLCVFIGKIKWVGTTGTEVKICYQSNVGSHKEEKFELYYNDIYQKRLGLLKQALLHDPNHYQSCARIFEIILENEGPSNFLFGKVREIKGLSYKNFGSKNLSYFYKKVKNASGDSRVNFADKVRFRKEVEKMEKALAEKTAVKKTLMQKPLKKSLMIKFLRKKSNF